MDRISAGLEALVISLGLAGAAAGLAFVVCVGSGIAAIRRLCPRLRRPSKSEATVPADMQLHQDADIRQMLVIRKDLAMRRGKLAAQAAHAAMGALTGGPGKNIRRRWWWSRPRLVVELDPELEAWLTGRFKKIGVTVPGEAEMLALHQQAQAQGLRCSLIQDSGLTEFKEPTYTVLAIGPHVKARLDPLTGHLPLY